MKWENPEKRCSQSRAAINASARLPKNGRLHVSARVRVREKIREPASGGLLAQTYLTFFVGCERWGLGTVGAWCSVETSV